MSKPKLIVCINPLYASKREQLLNCIADFNNKGEIVLNGDRNSIKSFTIDNEKINIKSFKTPNFFNAFIYRFIRKSKAKRSFLFAKILLEKNISTPFPIAYIEEVLVSGLKNSYYISSHIDYNLDFRILLHQPKFPDRENILQQFTAFTYKLHENGINFLDHSPGNTLIKKRVDGNYDFYLIDLNRMKFETMSLEKRMHNFRRLWLSKTMIKIMAKTYAEIHDKPYEQVYHLMLNHSRAFQKKVNSKKLRRSGRKMKFKANF